MIHEVTTVQFEVVSAMRQIPERRACILAEEAGAISVYIRDGHANKRLCDALNDLHKDLLGGAKGRWAQTWDDRDPQRVEVPPVGRGLADVQWKIVPASALPAGADCLPLEERGHFTWLIKEGFASQQLCDEMNVYLKRITGDGLWVQRWDDPPESPHHS